MKLFRLLTERVNCHPGKQNFFPRQLLITPYSRSRESVTFLFFCHYLIVIPDPDKKMTKGKLSFWKADFPFRRRRNWKIAYSESPIKRMSYQKIETYNGLRVVEVSFTQDPQQICFHFNYLWSRINEILWLASPPSADKFVKNFYFPGWQLLFVSELCNTYKNDRETKEIPDRLFFYCLQRIAIKNISSGMTWRGFLMSCHERKTLTKSRYFLSQ